MELKFIDIHTHIPKADDKILQIVNINLETLCPQESYCSYGIHPWALDKVDFQIKKAFALLEERVQLPNVIALGEAGLDKMHKESFEKQMELFERQIELSEVLQKPMILHDVRSHNEILALCKKHKAKQPWILHGFNGTERDIKQLTGQGLYLSVGESLLHSERKIYNSFKFIDLDFLFLETDMSEVGIETIYEQATKLLDIDVAVLQRRLFANFARLFGHNT
jgi:TatD DNase family protein